MAEKVQTKHQLPTWDLNPIPSSLNLYNIALTPFLQSTNIPFPKLLAGICTNALVFHPTTNCILLVQRAAHDSMPNRWEPPGGAADIEDETLLHACARELYEESGLTATKLLRIIPDGKEQGSVFFNRNRTKTLVRYMFEVEVESCEGVKLDPEEHQDWVWASEEEVRMEVFEGRGEVKITVEGVKRQLLEAFRMRREKGREVVNGEEA